LLSFDKETEPLLIPQQTISHSRHVSATRHQQTAPKPASPEPLVHCGGGPQPRTGSGTSTTSRRRVLAPYVTARVAIRGREHGAEEGAAPATGARHRRRGCTASGRQQRALAGVTTQSAGGVCTAVVCLGNVLGLGDKARSGSPSRTRSPGDHPMRNSVARSAC